MSCVAPTTGDKGFTCLVHAGRIGETLRGRGLIGCCGVVGWPRDVTKDEEASFNGGMVRIIN